MRIMLSNAAVGLAESSLDSHSLVGFQLSTILPVMVESHFSVRNIRAVITFPLSSSHTCY